MLEYLFDFSPSNRVLRVVALSLLFGSIMWGAVQQEVHNWPEGGETGAYDANLDFDGRPDGGVDVGPSTVFGGDTINNPSSVDASYADAVIGWSACHQTECIWEKCSSQTYNPPNKKIPTTCSFLVIGICNFHINGIGSASVRQSVTTFSTAVVVAGILNLMHVAGVVMSQDA